MLYTIFSGRETSASFDQENMITREFQLGDWRKNTVELTNLSSFRRTPKTAAKDNRNNYKDFFSTDGSVDWQDEMLARGRA